MPERDPSVPCLEHAGFEDLVQRVAGSPQAGRAEDRDRHRDLKHGRRLGDRAGRVREPREPFEHRIAYADGHVELLQRAALPAAPAPHQVAARFEQRQQFLDGQRQSGRPFAQVGGELLGQLAAWPGSPPPAVRSAARPAVPARAART